MATELEKVLCKKCRLEFGQEALFCPNCGTPKNRDLDGDPILGTTVGGRYQLIQQIGQGASGAIYRGEHVTLRRKVAIKVLHHELSRDDLAIERFRREATTVGDLDNDHIVQIYDFGRADDGRLYLAMEYLEGRTLADIIEEKGRLSIEEVVDILSQLGEALMEAHAMGYVHRDLRPRNMFLAMRRTRANYLKLLDFGLAKLVEQEGEAASTSLGMTFGDPHYMSPEQAKGQPVDRRADIYSMGCIAYEMLTGHPPFHGGKVFDVLTRHVEEKPRALAEVAPETPAWLERAIMRCLGKKAEDRYITVYRLVEALRQGTDSGVIMSDEIARRRPTNPPASVSRAMERLAARAAELEGAAPEHSEEADTTPNPSPEPVAAQPSAAAPSAAAPSAAAQPVAKSDSKGIGSQTVLGFGLDNAKGADDGSAAPSAIEHQPTLPSPQASNPQAQSPQAAAAQADVQRNGVVVASEAAADAPAHDARMAATRLSLGQGPASGKSGGTANLHEPSAESSSGLSAVWYADGDSLEGGDGLSLKDQAKLNKARGHTPSQTGLLAQSDDDFYEEFDSSKRIKKVLIGVAGFVGVIVLAAVLWPSGDAKKSSEKAAGSEALAAVTSIDAAVALVQSPDAGAATAPSPDAAASVPVAGDTKTVVLKPEPRDPKPRDPKPRDLEPRDPKPRDVKPRDPKPRDPKPRDPKPDDPDPILDFDPNGPSAADKASAKQLATQGSQDLQSGDILGAASNFNKARKLDPQNAQAVAGLGEIALSQGAYTAAIGHLGKAARMRPKSPRIHILLGEAYLGSGNSSKAADSFKRALKISPDNARAREGYNEATGS